MTTCDRCSEEWAVVECAKCSFSFCRGCDSSVHALPRTKDHMRTPIANVPPGKPGGDEDTTLDGILQSVTTQLGLNQSPTSSPPSSPPQRPLPPPVAQRLPIATGPNPAVVPRYVPGGGVPPPPADDFIPPPPPDGPDAPPIPQGYGNPAPMRPQPQAPSQLRASGPPGRPQPQMPQAVPVLPLSAQNFEIPRPQASANQGPTIIPPQQFPNTATANPILPPVSSVRTSNFEIPAPSNAKPATIQPPLSTGGAPKNFRLVLVGTGGVGKSAVTIRFTQGTFTEDEYDPTIEDSYKKTWNLDGQAYTLDILDTAGQEEYSSLRDGYMRTGHGFIVVYAINSRATWNEVPDLRNAILRSKDVPSVPMILVGNKCDLENDRKVTQEEGRQLAQQWNCAFVEASAKGNINVPEIFNLIIYEILKCPPQESTSPNDKRATKKFSMKNLFSGGKKK